MPDRSDAFDPAGLAVTVMGIGRFGGGVGVIRWLAANGASVLATDLLDAEALAPALEDLRPDVDAGRVTLRLGEHRAEDFTSADAVVVSPAVPHPWDHPHLQAAGEANVPLLTEIGLVIERLGLARPSHERVIGVTGTAGKSTTAALIHHILRGAGVSARLGGNIGGSLLDVIDTVGADEWIVLELSSAMLYWLGPEAPATTRRPRRPDADGWSPHIGVLTNIAPNHLDWHGDPDHYARSKQNIGAFQTEDDVIITGDDLGGLPRPDTLALPGVHNRANASMAIAAAHAAGVDLAVARDVASTFRGLPHRLELVAEAHGVRAVNDSKSTTPEATLLAIEAMGDPRSVRVIVGGYDKGVDLAPLAAMAGRVAGMYAIGAVGPAIVEASQGRAKPSATLSAAVGDAFVAARAGETVLLSPGCASWDQFDNYEQRGEAFSRLAREALGVTAT